MTSPLRSLPFWVATAVVLFASYLFYEHLDLWNPQHPPVAGVEVKLHKQTLRGTLSREGEGYVIELADGKRVSFASQDAIMITFPGPFPKGDSSSRPRRFWRILVPASMLGLYLAFVAFWLWRGRAVSAPRNR